MSFSLAIQPDFCINDFYDYEPVGKSSSAIPTLWANEKNYLKGSAADWLPTTDAAFRTIQADCRKTNWDGEGAIAIADSTIGIAKKIVEVLYRLVPKGTPAPDVIPESDGEIGIDWAVDGNKLFSVSIGSRGRVNFSGQFGDEGGLHGWKPVSTNSQVELEVSLREIAGYVEKLYPPTPRKRAAR